MKMGKTLAILLGSFLAISLFSAVSFAQTDRLVVQDAGSNNVFTVDDTGVASATKVGIGTDAPELQLHVIDEAAAPDRGIVTGQHNSAAQAAIIRFKKSRGTFTAPTAMVNGDYFGVFQSWGHDGTAYERTAQFGFRTNGTVSTGSIPTDIVFWAGDNAVNLTETLRLKSTGTINMLQLSGSYSGGSAYLCIDNNGDVFTSETGCP